MSGERTVILDDSMVLSLKDDFRNIIRDVILEVLPEVMCSELPKIMIDVSERTQQIERAKLDAKSFMDKNSVKFNESFKK